MKKYAYEYYVEENKRTESVFKNFAKARACAKRAATPEEKSKIKKINEDGFVVKEWEIDYDGVIV